MAASSTLYRPIAVVDDAEPPLRTLVVAPRAATRRTLIGLLYGADCRIREAEDCATAIAWHRAESAQLILYDGALPLAGPVRACSPRAPFLVALTSGVNAAIPAAQSADEYFIRPLQIEHARLRMQHLLHCRAAKDALLQAEDLLLETAEVVERRVPGNTGHCERLREGTRRLGQVMGLAEADLLTLSQASTLHDIGKLHTPDSLLLKPGLLTADERCLMEAHTIDGERLCRPLRTLASVLPVIRHHHERWDGLGYPDSVGGEEIPLLARVLQVVDIYDALTHARPYKPAIPERQALEILIEEARRGWRDPNLVALFAALRRPQ